MCGIAGIIKAENILQLQARLKKMADALAHRGPDGEGFWINHKGNAGFGHRRLSIIDLSAAAAQPMHYLNRYSIVYNGEIYNYIELRESLRAKSYSFTTQSDTEVILAAYVHYREQCLQHFDGMFAFAIWDEQEQTLFAARDRFGEKPFYYGFRENECCFASERKALWAAGFEKRVNYPLLLNYLALGHTQTPLDATITYFQHVFSLPPAHYLVYHAATAEFELSRYWDADKETQAVMNDQAAFEKFRELFFDSVSKRLRSDVPLGTSLSGGLDSSSIVASIKQLQPAGRLQTFSAVFPGFEKDESAHISLLAEKFGLNSHTITPTADDLIKNFEKLCYHQEEPFISSSIYAQYKVFELAAKQGVTVLLDGQGADETLAGYHKYIHWCLQELLRKNPASMMRASRELRKNGIPFQWGWKNWPAAWFPAQAAIRLEKREASRLLNHPGIDRDFKKTWFDRQSLFKPMVMKLNDMLYFDTCQSGLEELLRYADRNSMAHGREVRLPFLNHSLVEFIFSLPSSFKIRHGWTKWLLRKSMEDLLPASISWRRDKTGYEPPQRSWMENKTLQEYIYEAKSKLVKEKILNPAVLNKKIQPQHALAAENDDWRYMVAAGCL